MADIFGSFDYLKPAERLFNRVPPLMEAARLAAATSMEAADASRVLLDGWITNMNKSAESALNTPIELDTPQYFEAVPVDESTLRFTDRRADFDAAFTLAGTYAGYRALDLKKEAVASQQPSERLLICLALNQPVPGGGFSQVLVPVDAIDGPIRTVEQNPAQ